MFTYKKLLKLNQFAVTCLLLIMLISCNREQKSDYLNESGEKFDQRMEWWRDAGFGMFIHWGVYSVPAGVYNNEEIPGIGEWIMDKAKIPIPEYEKFARQFNPVKFNAQEWVRIAKNAGMKYIVITSKHHDGFCLWDTELTDYNIIDYTEYKHDVLKELSKACEDAGIKFCFYHSIMDWHHPDAKGDNFHDYREKYLKPQLKELLTGYGDIGVLWFDGEWIEEWTEEQGKDLYNYVRNLQPDIIINNRVGKGRKGMQGMNKGSGYAGDFGTPEQSILEGKSDLDWESCMTMNDTWGFKKHDHNWKSSKMLIHNLVDIAAKGGNYLLNVGPTSEGLIPDPSVERLSEMGNWMDVNCEVIYNSIPFEFYKEGENIRFIKSKNDEFIYAVALEWPGNTLKLESVKVEEGTDVKLLGYDIPLKWETDNNNGIVIYLPEELQEQENRPCKYAWAFRIEGKKNGTMER